MQTINTFTKGMNTDIDYSMLGKDQYLYSENFRLITETINNTGSLENILGNKQLSSIVSYTFGFYICGYCTIRNELYLFITNNINNNPTGGRSKIVKILFNATGTDISSISIIYDDESSLDGSRLELSFLNKIKAIGRYESDSIKKIYWVDGHNNIRFANVANDISTYPANKFDIISNYNASQLLSFSEFVSGSLTSGRVQYAYQLYDVNGGETLFSQPSPLISISSTSGQTGSNKTFKGSDIGVNTGKGIKLSFTPSTIGYSRIRVVSIKYDSLNSVPSINIIADQTISDSSSAVYFYDYGINYLGSYTYEEYAIVGNLIFSASEIETKNDYLFVGNIKQVDWDVTYDARAYRFAGANNSDVSKRGKAGIYQSINGSWDEVSTSFTIGGNPVPETHNCINPYNDIRNDTDTTLVYYYQTDLVTPGGEGPNVSYKFNIDGTHTTDLNTLGATEEYTNNSDYSNVNVDINYLGYQRDEIYRFGIVFFNEKGQASTVKWIGDVRFPEINTLSYVTSFVYTSGDISYAVPLGIIFTLNTYSAYTQGAKYFKIVRVKRESSDRTVVAQGAVGCTALYTMSPNLYGLPYNVTYGTSGGVGPAVGATNTLKTDLVEFLSPEVNFNKNIQYKNGDRLDRVGYYTSKVESEFNVPSSLNIRSSISKYRAVSSELIYKEKKNIQKTIITDYLIKTVPLTATELNNNYSVDVGETVKFVNFSQAGNGVSFFLYGAAGGTKLILKLESGFLPVGIPSNSMMLCNYRRPLIESQYGGCSYQSRQNNNYISCSDINTCYTYSAPQDTFVFSGDTYIAMYDYLRGITIQGANGGRQTQKVLYFPVETSINLRYRQDDCYSKTSDDTNHGKVLLNEFAGKYQWSGDANVALEQKTNLYIYNSTYSQENTTIKYYPKNDLVLSDTHNYDSRVHVSEKKYNGELSDSWLKFKMDNFLDVDSTYGAITTLKNYKNILYFWQPKGFGAISVNPRSLLQDNNPGELVLGTGGVLDRYDYISTVDGCNYRNSVVAGLNGLYWIDSINKSIIRYNGTVESLSKIKGLNSFLKDINGSTLPSSISGYDKKNNEVLFQVYHSGVTNMLSYNELLDCFNGVYTYNPSIFIETNNTNYITGDSAATIPGLLFIHGLSSSDGKGYFYGVRYSSKVKFVVNDNYNETKTFDYFRYPSISLSSYNVNDFVDTFKTVRVYNSYQNSDFQTISYGGNIIKKEGEYRLSVPRNSVTVMGNVDIFNSSYINTTKSFKERMRDKYLVVDFTYVPQTYSESNFTVPYIITNYRISKR